jgi:hypothetical protein
MQEGRKSKPFAIYSTKKLTLTLTRMKTLPLTFKKYGHAFTQIVRQDDVALYKRINKEGVV